MKLSMDVTLIEQRQRLRQQLRTQRELIAHQLDPAPAEFGGYPRSKTMRFLTRRPALTAGLLAGLAGLVLRGRFFKTMTTALGVLRAVRSVRGNRTVARPLARRN